MVWPSKKEAGNLICGRASKRAEGQGESNLRDCEKVLGLGDAKGIPTRLQTLGGLAKHHAESG